jgi:2-methylcitrate dehydratase PrpD
MTITRTLARFVVQSDLSAIPAAVRHEATRSFLNWLGCAAGGCRHEAVEKACSVRSTVAGTPQATLIGRNASADVLTASFINGIAAHVLDFDDGQPRNTNLNPSGAVAPAPLALGERLKSPGKDVLHAFILGLEVECRIANAVYVKDNTRWFTNSTTGVFGAAAAASKVLQLDEQRTAWALGIAATQASGLREMFGTMCKSFSVGRAAESGLLAALLAREGFTSSDKAIEAPRGFAQVFLPGSDPNPIVEGLGETYEVSYNIYKPFACGIVLHAAIDACVQVREEHRFEIDQIDKVTLRVHPVVTEITGKRAPQSGLETKFSVYHCAAVALIDGAAGEKQFSDERARNTAVVGLRDRVEAVPDPDLRRDQAHVLVRLRDGRQCEKRIEHAIGTLNNPLTDRALEAKFEALAEDVLSPAATRKAIDLCWDLERLGDISVIPAAAAGARERAHA